MKFQLRLFVVLISVAVATLAVFYLATTIVIQRAFEKVETDTTKLNTARAVDAFTNRIDQLEVKASDWASWDDTYVFAINRNAAYIRSNLQSEALSSLGIHYILFFDPQGNLVHSKAVSADTGEDQQVPADLIKAFRPGSLLLATTPESQAKGLVTLADRTVQFAALPILTSGGSGPLHGTIVFAADLLPAHITELSDLTHLDVSFYRLNDASRPADVKAAVGEADEPTSALARPSENVIVGYQTINDAYNEPALVARVERPREIHQAAMSAIRSFSLITLVAATLGTTLILVLVHLVRGRDRTIALKNEFFSIASHELRTPLTVIRNYAQLMKFQFAKAVNDPKFEHMTDQIDQAGAQLIGVVNVYLDAARLESGKIPFQVMPFAMSDIAARLSTQLQTTGKSKNIHVTMDCPATLPLVLGDKERVQQIVLNLFGNAMKFTDQGTIAIKAEVRGPKMMVYVTDSGRGMDESAQKKLFQRFTQVKTKDAMSGSGLGLFISKKLIEQMGGTIQVESSAPGIGTTLSFSLPLAPQETPAATPVQAPPTDTTPPAPPA